MNWKECPNMFANGKFKFIDYWGEEETLKGVIVYDYGTWLLNVNGEEISDVEYCKLVARPLSDMSYEEVDELYNHAPIEIDGKHPTKDEIIEFCHCQTDGFLYLLSIGVYPFDDDTGVICRYENE